MWEDHGPDFIPLLAIGRVCSFTATLELQYGVLVYPLGHGVSVSGLVDLLAGNVLSLMAKQSFLIFEIDLTSNARGSSAIVAPEKMLFQPRYYVPSTGGTSTARIEVSRGGEVEGTGKPLGLCLLQWRPLPFAVDDLFLAVVGALRSLARPLRSRGWLRKHAHE
jgi:hypothetical protein